MIPGLKEILISLYGAWRLACRDAGAIALFDASTDGVLRSFFAAVLVAPAYALMLAMRYAALLDPPPAIAFALSETIAYVISWVAYPLIMASLTRALGRFGRWPLFVCAYNWSLVIQNALVLPFAILSTAGVFPPEVGELLWLPLLAALVAYSWFIVRAALGVTAVAAIGIVGLDFALSIVIDAVADAMH